MYHILWYSSKELVRVTRGWSEVKYGYLQKLIRAYNLSLTSIRFHWRWHRLSQSLILHANLDILLNPKVSFFLGKKGTFGGRFECLPSLQYSLRGHLKVPITWKIVRFHKSGYKQATRYGHSHNPDKVKHGVARQLVLFWFVLLVNL